MSAIVSALARIFSRGSATRLATRARFGTSAISRGSAFRAARVRGVVPKIPYRYTANKVLIPPNLTKSAINVQLRSGTIAKAGSQFPKNWPLGFSVEKSPGFNKALFKDARLRGLMSESDYSIRRFNRPENYFKPQGSAPLDIPLTRPLKANQYQRLRSMLNTFRTTPGVERGPAGRRVTEYLGRSPLKNLNLPTNIKNVPANIRAYIRNLYARLRAWYRNRKMKMTYGHSAGRYRGFYPSKPAGPLRGEPLPNRFYRQGATRSVLRAEAANKPMVRIPTSNYFHDVFGNLANTERRPLVGAEGTSFGTTSNISNPQSIEMTSLNEAPSSRSRRSAVESRTTMTPAERTREFPQTVDRETGARSKTRVTTSEPSKIPVKKRAPVQSLKNKRAPSPPVDNSSTVQSTNSSEKTPLNVRVAKKVDSAPAKVKTTTTTKKTTQAKETPKTPKLPFSARARNLGRELGQKAKVARSYMQPTYSSLGKQVDSPLKSKKKSTSGTVKGIYAAGVTSKKNK